MLKILFVCGENACRSQMAEGFARHHGGPSVEAFSAGSAPAARVNPLAVEVMGEKGIDISKNAPKNLMGMVDIEFDCVVGMGCENTCPVAIGKKHIQWSIPDPAGEPIERFREVRDMIESHVLGLLAQLRDGRG